MIFAAGLGTRLRPLTYELPKALLDVNGAPLLELVMRRLAAAGVKEFVVNTHHFHEKIEAFLRAKDNFGLKVEISREAAFPLETGGGLKKAAAFFSDGTPFFAYNADVYSEMDLGALYAAHLASGALVTLAVRERPSKRRLLFDARRGNGRRRAQALRFQRHPGHLAKYLFRDQRGGGVLRHRCLPAPGRRGQENKRFRGQVPVLERYRRPRAARGRA